MSMKKFGLVAGSIALSFGLTAPVEAQSAGRILGGAGIGAAGGAVAGALIPGLSPLGGAAIGAAGGAAYRALDKKHHYYRDGRGRRYYVDHHGYRRYR